MSLPHTHLSLFISFISNVKIALWYLATQFQLVNVLLKKCPKYETYADWYCFFFITGQKELKGSIARNVESKFDFYSII